jgi:hypothetical protein
LLKLRSHAALQSLETDSDEFLEVHHVTLSLLNVILTSNAYDVANDLLSHLHEVILEQVGQGYLLLENSLDFLIFAAEQVLQGLILLVCYFQLLLHVLHLLGLLVGGC